MSQDGQELTSGCGQTVSCPPADRGTCFQYFKHEDVWKRDMRAQGSDFLIWNAVLKMSALHRKLALTLLAYRRGGMLTL